MMKARVGRYVPYGIIFGVNAALLLPALMRPAFFYGDSLFYLCAATAPLGFYRPVFNVLNRILFALFSFEPLGYRVVTFGLHVALAMCFYAMIRKISFRRSVALISAILFSCHFLHLKIFLRILWIDYITIALLSCAACILLGRSVSSRRFRGLLFVCSVLVFTVALFTNMLAGAMLAVLFFYYLFNIDGELSLSKVWQGIKLLFPYGVIVALFMEFSCNPQYQLSTASTAENLMNAVVCVANPALITSFFCISLAALLTPFVYVPTYEYLIPYGMDLGESYVLAFAYASFVSSVFLFVWIRDARYRFGFGWLFLFLLAGSFGNPWVLQVKYLYMPLLGSSYLVALLLCDGVGRLIPWSRVRQVIVFCFIVLAVFSSVGACYKEIKVRFSLGELCKKIYCEVQGAFSSAPQNATLYLLGDLPGGLCSPEMYHAFITHSFFRKNDSSDYWSLVQWDKPVASANDLNSMFLDVSQPVDAIHRRERSDQMQAYYVSAESAFDDAYRFPGTDARFVYAYFNNAVCDLAELIEKERSVTFVVRCSNAERVSIAGDFNAWQPEPLASVDQDQWARELLLPAGTYRYKICINDELWVANPQSERYAEHDTFGEVSVMVVPLVEV